MKKLILIQNDCPKSGKSTIATAITRLLNHHRVGYSLVHTDESRMDDPDFFDLEEFDPSMIIALVDREPVTVIDVATGTSESLADVFSDFELEDLLAELDVEITVVIPAVANRKSLDEIVRIGETFSDGADYIIAMSGTKSDRLCPDDWRSSYAAKGMGYLGAVEIDIQPASPTLTAILSEHQITLSEAISNLSKLPDFAKSEIRAWLESCFSKMAVAHDFLLGDFSSVPEHMLRYVSSYGSSSK